MKFRISLLTPRALQAHIINHHSNAVSQRPFMNLRWPSGTAVKYMKLSFRMLSAAAIPSFSHAVRKGAAQH